VRPLGMGECPIPTGPRKESMKREEIKMDESDSQLQGERQRARWSRLAVLGLLMEAAAPALFLLAVLIWKLDFGEDATFFVIVMAIPLFGALLVWHFGWWASLIGIITAVLPAVGMFWTAFGLAFPGSFFDFVPGFLVIPGALIAIVSLIASLVAGRRGRRGAAATGGEKTAIRVVAGLITVLALVSAVLTLQGRSSVSNASAGVQTVQMKNFKFEPRAIELEAGEAIRITNDDPFFHTFTVEALGIDQSFTPGDVQLVTVPDKPGTYFFYCRPHTANPDAPEQDDMAGGLTVR
jgi:plastocyanin